VFEIFGVTQVFDGRAVLDIERLAFESGRIYCFYGPNGSGKTTLFEILTQLRTPTTGRILFQGQEVYPNEAGMADLRSRVTLVHQDPLLFDTTVERNVDYGLRLRKIPKEQRKARVSECLRLVRLDGFQKRKARSLSGGEAQRVAIARALAIQPTAIFLDEFSANVDHANRSALEAIIRAINAQSGTTIIFTTHYTDQAYRVADEVIHLFRGKPVSSPVKNIFHGIIEHAKDVSRFSNDHLSFDVVSSYGGQATVTISAEIITLSAHPLESSMRNCLQGQITHIIDAGTHIDLKVLAGESFEVTITKRSFHEMGLHPGMPVYLNFKASAVEIYEG
jgi:tungstate transport system ATP-binding protein